MTTTVTLTTASVSPWECPPSVFEVLVRCWGGAGAGRRGDGVFTGGNGGGGGAYSEQLLEVVPGNLYAFVVGTGGAIAGSAGGAGGNGGDTWFFNTSTVLAKGGTGGSAAGVGTGGQASAGVGSTKWNGGNGGAQNSGTGGGGGGGAGEDGNGLGGGHVVTGNGPEAGAGGAGATYPGGAGGTGSSGNGSAPSGAGAGGASNGVTAGTGAAGKIVIEYDLSATDIDNIGLTESYEANLVPFNRAGLVNHSVDMQWNGQVKELRLGLQLAWFWISEFPYEVDMADLMPGPGRPWIFVVPDGCTEIEFEGRGARGGAGAANAGVSGPGGAGGLLRGVLTDLEPGDVLYGHIGIAGGAGGDVSHPVLEGGVPGGVGPQLNAFSQEFAALGGVGGGLTSIIKRAGGTGVRDIKVIVGAGGGGGAGSGGETGGAGGAGGGSTGGAGLIGAGTALSVPQGGTGGGGGTQVAGGAGGVGGPTSTPSSSQSEPGAYLGGGITWRNRPYGSSLLVPWAAGGGGGGGLYGGGAGGNGATNGFSNGGGGGGGGGSSFADSDVEVDQNLQGGNSGNDGAMVFTFFAKRGLVYS